MEIKVEKLHFTHFDEQYKKHKTECSYELEFNETGLKNVRNELGFKVEPNSYTWEYFSAKYK